MTKLSIYNKIFIMFFAILVVIIIWKVPHETNAASARQATITNNK